MKHLTSPWKVHLPRIGLFTLVFGLLFAPAVLAQEQAHRAPLFDGLGTHHHDVITDSDLAQQYFDQGLVLAFGFNHGEAHRSFLQAAREDSSCAMCWWGAAWVLGPNINAAMNPADAPEAWRLLKNAQSVANGVSPREKAYVSALSKRYGPEPLEDRSPRDRAFAEAMETVARQYPDDLDAKVLYAEALMDLTPWDYWLEDGTPRAITDTVLTVLGEVLRHNPDHPMANHLMIHAVEALRPAQGLEEARRLEDLVPGVGHLVHMPAHIYIRLGQYHEATAANLRAIDADRRYLQQVDAQGVYRLAYVPHNYHFGWATATLEGRSGLAIRLAREMSSMVDTSAMRERSLTTLQHYWITPVYALVRFGRWKQIIQEPEPAEDLIYPRAIWHYARGMAYTRGGVVDSARLHLKELDRLRKDSTLQWVTVWDLNKSQHILQIASLALSGELAAAEGRHETAIHALEQAVEREDALNYDEPPTWHYPTRQSLGAILLAAGHPARAEEVYRQDLARFPENGWSLYGLLQALRAQGNVEDAEAVARRFHEAWRHADVVLTSSRF